LSLSANAMTANVLQATFCSIRHVQGRKVYQLIFEIAQENADHALAVLGGVPKSDDPVWAAIVRLKSGAGGCGFVPTSPDNREGNPAQPSVSPAGPEPALVVAGASPEAEAQGQGKPGKPKRRFSEMPRSSQAAMLCENPVFQRWFLGSRIFDEGKENELRGNGPLTDITADHLRRWCVVESRREFDTDNAAGARWDILHSKYLYETNQMAEDRS